MLTFLHIGAFWLLPLPLLVRWLVPARVEAASAIRVPFVNRLQAAGGQPSEKAAQSAATLFIPTVVWLLLVAALARPQRLEEPLEQIIPTRDLLLVVDLSGSMDHQDFTNTDGESVNRLDAVKEVVGEFLMKREGDRVGLVVFGNSPFLQVPFTTDLALCEQLLQETQVGMAGPQTAFGDAIGLGIKLFESSDVPQRTMITLTDGNDSASQVPAVEAARVARDNEITIHSIAIGDPTTVGEERLDEETLRGVAGATGGDFFFAADRDELAGIYQRLDEIETREVKTVSHQPRTDLYFWLVAAALMLSMLTAAGQLFRRDNHVDAQAARARVRVNARTFELETTEP